MGGLLKKIETLIHNRTTYRVGLLQAKAYRALKKRTGDVLSQYDISTVEWALLGLLFDHKDGMRSLALAHELGVEAPFITALFSKLEKQGYVEREKDQTDSRVKIICLTEEGRRFVEKTEASVRAHMKPLIAGAAVSDVLVYVSVLERITQNAEKLDR